MELKSDVDVSYYMYVRAIQGELVVISGGSENSSIFPIPLLKTYYFKHNKIFKFHGLLIKKT
ncbi:hypothetical protein DJ531_08060 [Sulfolobus sp. A20-N-F6]|nr:hypothetical protein DJ531_08060 [Sulfolobus sp. A20-N-F6]TRM86348.1 hypothetical protein DJ529_11510 [Sulfolobus sp. C3]